MNKRQQKKRVKKALEVLNSIPLWEADMEREGVIYVLIENNSNNHSMLNNFCGLLGIDKSKFIFECSVDVDEDYLDLVNVWSFCPEPKGYAVFYSSKHGFLLQQYDEMEEIH